MEYEERATEDEQLRLQQSVGTTTTRPAARLFFSGLRGGSGARGARGARGGRGSRGHARGGYSGVVPTSQATPEQDARFETDFLRNMGYSRQQNEGYCGGAPEFNPE